MELEKQTRGIYSCTRCGVCVHKYNSWGDKKVCPVREHTNGLEHWASRGRNQICRGVLEGTVELSAELAEVAYTCLLCGSCRQACGAQDMLNNMKPLISQPENMKALRADLFASGVELPEAVNMFGNAIEKSFNIFGAPAEERTDWLTPDIKVARYTEAPSHSGISTVFFPGCLSSYRSAEIAQATARILNAVGIEFSIMGEEEHCCGDPMIMVGNLFLARELARYNWEHLKGRKVITSCAGCYRTFQEEYPKLLGAEYKIDAIHIVELLSNLIDEDKVKFTKKIKERVVYHDPCELGRDMGIYDQPRKIIKSIPGIELVEFESTREKTWCCGAGGGVKGVNFDLSVEIGKDKVAQALAVGATTVVSACPSCKGNINDAIRATGAKLRAIDITELAIEGGISSAQKGAKNAKNR